MDREQIMKEIRAIYNAIFDLGKRVSNSSYDRHQESEAQISDLQDLVIDNAYDETLAELGL